MLLDSHLSCFFSYIPRYQPRKVKINILPGQLLRKQETGLHTGSSFQAKGSVCLYVYVCVRVCVCMYIFEATGYMCYSLIQNQERIWILSRTSVQLCNYWQRDREKEEEVVIEKREEERQEKFLKSQTHLFPLLFQRQQLELICEDFSCLMGTSRELQCLCRKDQMIKQTFLQMIGFGFQRKHKVH